MKTKSSVQAVSRRQFIGGATIGTLGITVLPSHVLGLGSAKSPNEKLNIAAVGCGGKAADDIANLSGENIVALCDVDWARAANTFKKHPNAKTYKDFRKMLDTEKSVDAVIVAIPDHMHAFASMHAIKMGKHVYCEKPLTHSVWEAREVAKAAREMKVATQMGNQGQASEATRVLCETVWAGAIGPVHEAHIWTDRPSKGLFEEYWPQGVARPKAGATVPSTLDWEQWIGPAPMRPYDPAYHPFSWRGWWDFGTGALGDIGCHTFDPIFRALKLAHPTSVEAVSTRANEETYPVGSMVTYHFPARGDQPPLKLTWYDGGLRPARPSELEDGREMPETGSMLVGEKGKIITQKSHWELIPESRAREFGTAPKKLDRSPGHYVEWVDACKGSAKKPGSNFDWAGPLTEVVLLGNVALRLKLRAELAKHKLLWDHEKFAFTNLPEANKYLRREYREGWKLV